MKSVRGITRGAWLAMLVLLLVAVASSTASADSAAPVRPFAASFTLHVLQVFPIDSTHWYELQSGPGIASLLGKASETHDRLLVDISAFPVTGCLALSGPATLVAANGDELFATMSGSPCPQPDGSIPGKFHFSITGGTGRFAGATGSGVIDGNFVNGVITENWSGAIAY